MGCGNKEPPPSGTEGASSKSGSPDPAPTEAQTPAADSTVESTTQIPPTHGECVLTVENASEILGEPAVDEGFSYPRCTFSPASVSGYGTPEYVSVGEESVPYQSLVDWRTGRQTNGNECEKIIDRPELGTGAYEEHCFEDGANLPWGASQQAMLNVPNGQGRWALTVVLHQARLTSDTAAADLLHKALAVLRAG